MLGQQTRQGSETNKGVLIGSVTVRSMQVHYERMLRSFVRSCLPIIEPG